MYAYGRQAALEAYHTKIADDAEEEAPQAHTYTPAELRFLHQRFTKLRGRLNAEGALAGTGHKRIVIPKNLLTEGDILQLGFKPVQVAIPESGQDQFESYRHPDNLYHIHSHPEGWTMHEDQHPAATMLATKVTHPIDKARTYIEGLPHVLTEGIPGLFYYTKNQVSKKAPLARKVLDEMKQNGVNLYERMHRWVPSPTYQAPQRDETELKAAAERLTGGRGDGRPDNDFDPKALAKGMEVEREHSPDPKTRKEIAKDHLTESPEYYDELAKMEKKLEKKGACAALAVYGLDKNVVRKSDTNRV